MAERGDFLIRDGAIVSVDPTIGDLTRGSILVRDGLIVDVGEDVDGADAEVIDASAMLVMPGLIDSHHHLWSAIGRNFLAEGFEYYPAKWATSAAYEPDDFYNSVRLALAECVRAGITTVHNWSHNTRTPAHADAELSALRDGLVRARYSYGHRDQLPDEEQLDFTDIDRVTAAWFGADRPLGDLVHLGVNLRGPDAGLEPVFHHEMDAALSRGLPVAIHASQGADVADQRPRLRGTRLSRSVDAAVPLPAGGGRGPRGDGAHGHATELGDALGAAPRGRRRSTRRAAGDGGRRRRGVAVHGCDVARPRRSVPRHARHVVSRDPVAGHGQRALRTAHVPPVHRDGDDQRRSGRSGSAT